MSDDLEQKELRFSVEDTGIGIPSNKLTAIFSEFEQVDSSRSRKFGGTGLGLSIASRLVEMMDGAMHVESEINVGTRFHFDLTFTVDSSYELQTDKPFSETTLLIVDDNVRNLNAIEKLTQHWGMSTQSCGNAESALQHLLDQAESGTPFEIALVDCKMPESSGIELATRIRQEPTICEMKVVLMSCGERLGPAVSALDVERILKPLAHADLYNVFCGALQPDSQTIQTEAFFDKQARETIRILLAEDNPINQKLTATILRKQGQEVQIAANGLEAIEMHKKNDFDLILMDVQMPEMDGLQATREIRRMDEGRFRIPIIAMTAHATESDKQICFAAGIDSYLSKPFQIPELLNLIEKWTGHRARCEEPPAHDTPCLTAAIDWERAFDTVGGDQELLKDLFAVFLEEKKAMMDAIRIAIEEQNINEIRRAAHSLKGALSHLGAAEAATTTQNLELAGQDELLETSPANFKKLEQQIQQVTKEISAFLPS